jgi:hypothetical protein
LKNSIANTAAAQRGCGLMEGDSLFSKKCLTGYGLTRYGSRLKNSLANGSSLFTE